MLELFIEPEADTWEFFYKEEEEMWDFTTEWGALSRTVQDLGYHEQRLLIGQIHQLLEGQHTTVKMQPPEVNTATKGRPRLDTKVAQKSNKRDPSGFEYVEEECKKIGKKMKASKVASKACATNAQASGSRTKVADLDRPSDSPGLEPVSSSL